MDGIENDALILGGIRFTNLDLPKKLTLGNEYTFTATSVPYSYQIPDYNSSNWYSITLGNTSDTVHSDLVGSVLSEDWYSISETGELTVNTIVGTYYVYEFSCSEYVNNGA